VSVKSEHQFEAAAIGKQTCATLSTNQLNIYDLSSGVVIQQIKNEGNEEI